MLWKRLSVLKQQHSHFARGLRSHQTFESTAEKDVSVLVGQTSHLVSKSKIAVWDYVPIDQDTCEDPARLTVNDSTFHRL